MHAAPAHYHYATLHQGIAMISALLRNFCTAAQALWRRPPGPDATAGASPGRPLLTLAGSNDDPIVSFGHAAPTDLARLSSCRPLPEGEVARLSSLMQFAPQVLTATEFAKGQYLKCSVEVSKLARARNGELLGVVRDAAGKIRKSATFSKAGIPPVLGPALFQCVSMLVAQQHLAEINEKLDSLKQGVDKIAFHLASQQSAAAEYAYEHLLNQIAGPAMAGEWSPDFLGRLGDFEVELGTMSLHIEKQIEREIELLRQAKVEGVARTNPSFQAVQDRVEAIKKLVELWFMCVQARIIGLQVLALCPQPVPERFARLSSALTSEIQRFTASDGLPVRAFELAGTKSDTVKVLLPRQKAVEAGRTKSTENLQRTTDWLNAHVEGAKRQLSAGHSALEAMSAPLVLFARVDEDGRFQVLQSAA